MQNGTLAPPNTFSYSGSFALSDITSSYYLYPVTNGTPCKKEASSDMNRI